MFRLLRTTSLRAISVACLGGITLSRASESSPGKPSVDLKALRNDIETLIDADEEKRDDGTSIGYAFYLILHL
jgi:hypothetical protein